MKRLVYLFIFISSLAFGQTKFHHIGGTVTIVQAGKIYNYPKKTLRFNKDNGQYSFYYGDRFLFKEPLAGIRDGANKQFNNDAEMRNYINAVFNDEYQEGIQTSIEEIADVYGDYVYIKPKKLTKFGKNLDIDAGVSETLWVTGGNETYQPSNVNNIDSVSSSDNGDTQSITVEGHIASGDTLTFVSQTVTLTGQTPVVLPTPLHRMTRLFNNNGTDFAGTIYGYSGGAVTAGVPQVQDSIHLTVAVGDNQSFKAATTLSSYDYWLITAASFSVNRSGAQTRIVDFSIEIRNYEKVFRKIYPITVTNSGGSIEVLFDVPLTIPKESDVRVTAISSGADTAVSCFLSGFLALTK